jgi:hypothetical protein
VPVVPVRLEGATWLGRNFPDLGAPYVPGLVTVGAETFDAKAALGELFKRKAVEHSREYHDSFIKKLIEQLPII